jgi:hypothetical protein
VETLHFTVKDTLSTFCPFYHAQTGIFTHLCAVLGRLPEGQAFFQGATEHRSSSEHLGRLCVNMAAVIKVGGGVEDFNARPLCSLRC